MGAISLVLAAVLATPGARGTVDSVPVCAQMAASVTSGSRAGDLAATLGLHRGVVRWAPDGGVVRVWAQRRPVDGSVGYVGYTDAEWRAALVDAVAAWNDIVPGLHLAMTRDSAAADVRMVWARAMAAASTDDPSAGAFAATGPAGAAGGAYTAGRTLLVPDVTGRARLALVVVALAAPDGTPYRPRDVHAIAQHEIGHVLGLAHHASPNSVMWPTVRVDRVGGDDRAVTRALYALPVGAPCQPLGATTR